jgi:hypothetical protein
MGLCGAVERMSVTLRAYIEENMGWESASSALGRLKFDFLFPKEVDF